MLIVAGVNCLPRCLPGSAVPPGEQADSTPWNGAIWLPEPSELIRPTVALHAPFGPECCRRSCRSVPGLIIDCGMCRSTASTPSHRRSRFSS